MNDHDGSSRQLRPRRADRDDAGPLLQPGLRRAVAYGVAALVLAAVAWVVVTVLLHIWLVTITLAVALLLTALLAPLTRRLRGFGVPSSLAALASIIVLIAVPAAIGVLLYSRASTQLDDLATSVTSGVDRLRTWLTTGPLAMDPQQVDALRDDVVTRVQGFVPSAGASAAAALQVLAGIVLAIFAVFFLLKDGASIWRWVLGWVPVRHRPRVDDAGTEAWRALVAYVRGVVVVALADAVLIGAGLFFLGVPLWLSLTLLTFVGAFVPVLGATVAGAVAVLATLVTNGLGDALIVLALVVVVQQVEGNVLQPLIMGKAVDLHPLAILVAVTAGTLLLGIAGAVIAVPMVAVTYRVVTVVARRRDGAPDAPEQESPG